MHKIRYLIEHGWILDMIETRYRFTSKNTGEVLEHSCLGVLINNAYITQKYDEKISSYYRKEVTT